MTAPAPHTEAMQIAANVLHLARQEKWDEASAELSKIEPLRTHAQLTLIYGITDTALSYQFKARGGPPSAEHIVAPAWLQVDDAAPTTDAAEVPPTVRWVGQFMSARAAMNHGLCHDLLSACSGDEEWSARVSRLVEMSALMINTFDGATR